MRQFIVNYLNNKGFLASDDDLKFLEERMIRVFSDGAAEVEIEYYLDQLFSKGFR